MGRKSGGFNKGYFYHEAKGSWKHQCPVTGATKTLAKGKGNEKAAKAAYLEILKQGGLGASVEAQRGEDLTVAELIEDYRYWHGLEYPDPESFEAMENFYKSAKKRFGKKLAAQLVNTDVEAGVRNAINPKTGKFWKEGFTRNFKAQMKAMFKWAFENKKIPENNLKTLHLDSPVKTDKTTLSQEQIKLLEKKFRPEFRDFFRVIHLTGCRPKELANLIGAEVEDCGDYLIANLQNHKNKKKGKQRKIFFMKEAAEIVRQRMKRFPTGLIFRNSDGTKWRRKAWGNTVRRWRIKLKLPANITLYCNRHTNATNALDAGVPIHVVALALGTSVKQIEETYWRPKDDQIASVLSKIA